MESGHLRHRTVDGSPQKPDGTRAGNSKKPSTGRSKHGEGLAEGKENKGVILFSLAGSFRLAGGGDELGINEMQDGGKKKSQQKREVSLFCWD